MQVQTFEQTLFDFLTLGKSRLPPKKFYNINYRSNISTVPFMSPPATKSLNPSQDQKVLKWAQQLWFSCAKVYIEHALIFNC